MLFLLLTVLASASRAAADSCGASPNPNPPPSASCGHHGKLKTPMRLQPSLTSSSVSSCADSCKLTAGCGSFSYRQSTKACQLYSATLRKQGYMDLNTNFGSVFYDQACFQCASGCNEHNNVYSNLNGLLSTSATPFCSSYLGFGVSTVIDTVTLSKTAITTAPANTVMTTVYTSTSTDVVAISTSTTTIATVTASAYTLLANPVRRGKKREAALPQRFTYSPEEISSACSCFDITSGTTTVPATETTIFIATSVPPDVTDTVSTVYVTSITSTTTTSATFTSTTVITYTPCTSSPVQAFAMQVSSTSQFGNDYIGEFLGNANRGDYIATPFTDISKAEVYHISGGNLYDFQGRVFSIDDTHSSETVVFYDPAKGLQAVAGCSITSGQVTCPNGSGNVFWICGPGTSAPFYDNELYWGLPSDDQSSSRDPECTAPLGLKAIWVCVV